MAKIPRLPIPKLNHRLYAILVQVYRGPKSGIAIRQNLRKHGFVFRDQTFYRDMNSLEQRQLVQVAKYIHQAGGTVQRRAMYEITPKGSGEVEHSRDYYRKWFQDSENSS